MSKEIYSMGSDDYQREPKARHSLKQKLMAAVANGDEDTARKIREQLKNGPENPLGSEA